MTATDFIAAYGAFLATVLAVWEFLKYRREGRRLRVNCYVGAVVQPGAGVIARNLLVYDIANTGGQPIVVTTVGGALRDGSAFMLSGPLGRSAQLS